MVHNHFAPPVVLDWHKVNHVRSTNAPCQRILDRHANVLKEELGLVKGATARFHINPDAQPKFHKAWSVPYALRTKVESEQDRLEKDGIIEPVQFSDWAVPIVPVVKWLGLICQMLSSLQLLLHTLKHHRMIQLPQLLKQHPLYIVQLVLIGTHQVLFKNLNGLGLVYSRREECSIV